MSTYDQIADTPSGRADQARILREVADQIDLRSFHPKQIIKIAWELQAEAERLRELAQEIEDIDTMTTPPVTKVREAIHRVVNSHNLIDDLPSSVPPHQLDRAESIYEKHSFRYGFPLAVTLGAVIDHLSQVTEDESADQDLQVLAADVLTKIVQTMHDPYQDGKSWTFL